MSITMQQAADRADTMLDATLDAIKPEVHWTHSGTSTGACDVSRSRTVMTIISKERRGNFLGVVQRFWEKSGYRIKSVNKSERFPAIFAQSADGFGISLVVGGSGQVAFEVDSPCAKPSKVGDPTTHPNGPNYDYPVPRPNVHSDFWSSTTPIASASPGDKS
ncbi:ARID/BRIGHT DNA-binding domain-containing protein [Streptomyces sp. YIM S03343]